MVQRNNTIHNEDWMGFFSLEAYTWMDFNKIDRVNKTLPSICAESIFYTKDDCKLKEGKYIEV